MVHVPCTLLLPVLETVSGLGFGVQVSGLGFGVQVPGLGFGVQVSGLGFGVQVPGLGFGMQVPGLGCRVQSVEFRVQGSGVRVWGLPEGHGEGACGKRHFL